MAISKKTKYGEINISKEAIVKVAVDASLECYGVIGVADKSSLSNNIVTLLKFGEFDKGVYVSSSKDGYEVSIYLVLAMGVKITEVLSEVQKKVKYVLTKTFGLRFKEINVHAQDIKERED